MYTKEQRYSTSHVRRGADSMEVVGVPVVTSTHWIGLNTTPSNVTFGPVDFMVPHHFIPILRPPGTIANRVFAVFRMVSHSPSTVRNCDSLIQKFPNLLLDESSLHRFCGCRCTHADTEWTPICRQVTASNTSMASRVSRRGALYPELLKQFLLHRMLTSFFFKHFCV